MAILKAASANNVVSDPSDAPASCDANDGGASGVLLEFKNITFTVTAKGKKLEILKDVSSECKPGRLLAIMGASGAGKTTLLDILANNIYSGTMQGQVLVDGAPRQRKAFSSLSCYVQQRDILLSSATVREAITTSALLKLPRTMSRADKQNRVENTLKELDLVGCADTLIGDEAVGMKGISGGQKRRVSVGVDLVKDPTLIFLDEPTSGLDSEMAISLITTLLQLARKGRTVTCTIHQPNSDITSRFDDFLLLAKGRVVYAGPWSGSVDYFGSQGYSCPLYTNPTDYYMSIVREESSASKLALAFASYADELAAAADAVGSAITAGPQEQEEEEEEGAGGQAQSPSLSSPTHGQGSGSSGGGDGVVRRRAGSRDVEAAQSGGSPGGGGSKPQTSTLNQMRVLSIRFLRTWYRNPQMLASELVQYVFMALLVGLMYLQVSDDLIKGVYDRAACIWFSLAVLSFTPSYTAAVTWDSERLLLRRELSGNQYRPTAYFLAKTAVTLPLEVLQCGLFVSISYFMVGFQADAGKFLMQFAIFSAFLLTSESIGLLVAILARTATNSVVLLTLLLLLLLSFSGFLTAEIKPYFAWIKDLSYLTYAFTSAVQSEFNGLTLYDPSNGQAVDGSAAIPPQLDNGISMVANFGILLGQLLAYRAAAWLAMVTYAHFHLL